MERYELKKLIPANLSQTIVLCIHRTRAFGLYQISLDISVELKSRSDEKAFVIGHFKGLPLALLTAGEFELAQPTQHHISDDQLTHSRCFLSYITDWYRILKTLGFVL